MVIDGHPCAECGKWFNLSNYDLRVILDGKAYHPECISRHNWGTGE